VLIVTKIKFPGRFKYFKKLMKHGVFDLFYWGFPNLANHWQLLRVLKSASKSAFIVPPVHFLKEYLKDIFWPPFPGLENNLVF
jgi:hypothetical protein